MADRTRERTRSPKDRRRDSRSREQRRRAGSRANSYDDYSDDYTDYSDSLVSDNEGPSPRKNDRKPPIAKHGRRQGAAAAYKTGGKSKPGGGQQQKNTSNLDSVGQRMISARRLKLNELRNELESLAVNNRDLQEENKVLRRVQRRQEKALEKFQGEENDLPQLIQRHTNEVRSLRDQLRKAKEKGGRAERGLHDAEDELERTRRQVTKYRELAEEKELPERDELHRRILAAEADVQEKEKRIKDLERHSENLSKNHKHQIGIEIARYRELQRKHEELAENFNRMQIQLKEKEKELEVKNIYANRISRPSRLPASYSGTPNESPAPGRSDRPRRLSNSDMTPRQKAKQYEEDRRQREKSKLDRGDSKLDDKLAWERLELENEDHDREKKENKEKERRDRENRERKAEEEEREIRERVEREEREIRDKIEREAREKQERERTERESTSKRNEERRLSDERERKRQEDETRVQKEREREKADIERRAQEERERMENDVRLQEERKKKDLLLARLKQLDSGKPEQSTSNPFFITHDRNSDTSSAASKGSSYSFNKVTENLHNGKPSHEENPVSYIKKRTQHRSFLEDDSGYQPSFTGNNEIISDIPVSSLFTDGRSASNASKDSKKKSNLMDNLFGKNHDTSDSSKSKPKDDDLDDDYFSSSKKSNTNNAPKSRFPWDETSNSLNLNSSLSSPQKTSSSVLFAGGSAFVDDDNYSTGNNAELLPRRTRQPPTTFQSRPTVNAVDHYDDDIEEVIL